VKRPWTDEEAVFLRESYKKIKTKMAESKGIWSSEEKSRRNLRGQIVRTNCDVKVWRRKT
jgi:hypothetical protein